MISERKMPVSGEVWRHFKNNNYLIIDLAEHTETGEFLVVYRQLYAPYKVYCRPLKMFMSKTNKEKYPNAKQEYRFELVENI